MQVKTATDELQNYLIDASNLQGGFAEKLFIPEMAAEIAEILREAHEKNIKVPFPAHGRELSAARFLLADL